MKIVINACYGGFSLSPKAVAEIAKRKGRPCFFFTSKPGDMYGYVPIETPTDDDFIWHAFDIDNPGEVLDQRDFHSLSMEQRQASNDLYRKHQHSSHPDDRADPDLVFVVEALGKESWGSYAELKVVEIPDDIEYTIEEYDGIEHVAEQHRTWS